MKTLTYILLLPILCAGQVKEYCFTPVEIDSLYVIGKQWQFYTKEYPKRVWEVNYLADVIKERDSSVQAYISNMAALDLQLDGLNKKNLDLTEKLTMQKYGIKETWIGRAWDWIRPRLIWFAIGAGVGSGAVLTLNN